MADDGDVRVEIDKAQLRDLLAEVKEFDPMLARALRKRLRQIAGEIADAMQAEVKRSPPTGGRSPGSHRTRQQIAEGIGVKVATGKRRQGVFVSGSAKRMANGRAAMPRAYNKRTFRHPIFGTRKWISQRGNPYFGTTIKRYEETAEQAVADALTEALTTVRTGTPK